MKDAQLLSHYRERMAELRRLRGMCPEADPGAKDPTAAYAGGLIAELEKELGKLEPAIRETLGRVRSPLARLVLYDYYALAMSDAEVGRRLDRSVRTLARLKQEGLSQLGLSR